MHMKPYKSLFALYTYVHTNFGAHSMVVHQLSS